MSEGSQRYCGNCGAEVRQDTRFCVSCGAGLKPGSQNPNTTSSNSSPSEKVDSSANETLWTDIQSFGQRVREGFAGSSEPSFRQMSNRMVRWFESLPVALKVAVVGIVALVLLVLLSPLALIAAGLLLGISLIALLIRVAQRGEIKGWGLAAVVSLVLVFLLGGISNAVYGIGLPGLSNSGSEVASESLSDSGPGDVGSDPSGNPAFAGVDMSYIAWEFDVTCEQMDGNEELRHTVALELSELKNSPLGPQPVIDSLDENLVEACVGVDPLYAPASRAAEMTDEEVPTD